jgi:hypothetical protein
MREEIECREGKEAAERFREFTEKVMSVPKSEIDKRAADKRAKRQSEQTKQGDE